MHRAGRSEKRGFARRCSASFFNYVQPPLGRAALEEARSPLAFRPPSAFLVELAALLPSPPPFLPPTDPSRNPLTTSFHLFIRRSLLFLGKKILIGSRDSLAVYHLACLALLLVIIIPFPPASRITLKHPACLLTCEINPSNIESTLDARDLRWHR